MVVPQSETIGREALWNGAEAAERRCNATLAREVEIALPHELDAEAREALAFAFAERLASRYGIAIDVAIHEPSGRGDDRNHHAHLLTTTRVVETDGGFGKKVRVLDDRRTGPEEVAGIRELWAAMCNAALTAAGVAEVVDHRSHAERGLEHSPGRKLGLPAMGFEARTGTPSRRRTDHAVEAREPELVAVAMDDRSAAAQKTDQRVARANAPKMLLAQLRATFAAATAAVLAGRPTPTINAAFALTDGRAKSVPVPSRPAAGARTRTVRPTSTLFTSGRSPRTAVPVMAPQPQVAVRHRRPYDEEAEAAAMHRRVEAELAAESQAQVAQDRADAQRAAARSERVRLFTSNAGSKRRQIRMLAIASSRPHNEVSAAATGFADRRARVDGDDDHLRDRGREIVAATPPVEADQPKPTVDLARPQDGETLRVALMMARESIRKHMRTRSRIAQLAGVAGMNAEAFEALVGAREAGPFDPALIIPHPALAELWTAWAREERERDKQKPSRQGPAAAETTVTEQAAPTAPSVENVIVPAITPESSSVQPPHLARPTAEDHVEAASSNRNPSDAPMPTGRFVGATAGSEAQSSSGVEPTRSSGAVRRQLVIDYAMYVAARGKWKPDRIQPLAMLIGVTADDLLTMVNETSLTRYGTGSAADISKQDADVLNSATWAAVKAAGLDDVLDAMRAVVADVRSKGGRGGRGPGGGGPSSGRLGGGGTGKSRSKQGGRDVTD